MASTQPPITAILVLVKPSKAVIQEIPQRPPHTALTFLV